MSLPNVLCVSLNPAIDTTFSLPSLALGAVNRALGVHHEPAGKAINVAAVLSELRARFGGIDKIGVIGFLGQDNKAVFLQKFSDLALTDCNIQVLGQTRQNIKLTEADGRVTDINGLGFVVDEVAKTAFFQALESALHWADWVVVSGSLPRGFSLDDFEHLVSRLSQHKNWILDSSGEALALGIRYQPQLIKPNIDELCELVGTPCMDIKAQSAALKKLGITEAVVSMGEKGVHWLSKEDTLYANAPKVTVKSTVGAGDTLLAGIVFGCVTGVPKADCLKYATALAADAVGRLSGISDNDTITALSQAILVEKLTDF